MSGPEGAQTAQQETRAVESQRVGRFALVGLSGVAVNLAVLRCLVGIFGFHRWLALPFAIELSILSNFFLNNAWTFQDRNSTAQASLWGRLARYNIASLVGMLIQFIVFEPTLQILMRITSNSEPGQLIYIAQLAGIVVATAWNFISHLNWTWAQTPARAQNQSR